MKNQNKFTIGAIVVAVIIAGVSFFGGALYQRNQDLTSFLQRNPMMERFGRTPGRYGTGRSGFAFGPNRMGMRTALNGEVTNISGNQITIKLENGTTQTIPVTSSTKYMKNTSASQNDVKTGDRVIIFGQNQNGSLSAQIIQIQPSPTPTP